MMIPGVRADAGRVMVRSCGRVQNRRGDRWSLERARENAIGRLRSVPPCLMLLPGGAASWRPGCAAARTPAAAAAGSVDWSK